MIGHEEIRKSFLKLSKGGNLSHGYIFFGEPQVGKFAFAKSLANLLEKDEFAEPEAILSETLIIQPEMKENGERSIGIESIRGLKAFLFERPYNSKYRVAIVNDAQYLTDQAQSAILKIAEEPPEYAILILVAANPDILLKTVQSRFQKIYFGRVKEAEIKELLVDEYKVKAKEAEEIAKVSFGRPGRAVDLVENEKLNSIREEAKEFLETKSGLKDIVKELADIENRDKIEPFLEAVIAELSKSPEEVRKNYKLLKAVIHRHHMLNAWNTNKRIQIEAGLTPIIKNY